MNQNSASSTRQNFGSMQQRITRIAWFSLRLKMAEQIVRCPYCVLGEDFRLMLPRPEGWFIDRKSAHTSIPENSEFKCSCSKCWELNRVA